jgi:hypothetical protein
MDIVKFITMGRGVKIEGAVPQSRPAPRASKEVDPIAS